MCLDNYVCCQPLNHGERLVFRYDYDSEDYNGRYKSFSDSGDEVGICQPYHGGACSGFIGNEIVYIRERFRPSQVEDSLTGRIVISLNLDCRTNCGSLKIRTDDQVYL